MAEAPRGGSIRPAEDRDATAVAHLIYSTARDKFERFGGDGRRALALIEAAFHRAGTDSSREAISVLERSGLAIGAAVAFDADEAARRARGFLRLALRRTSPRHWPSIVRLHRLGRRISVPPPPNSLYLDVIATDPAHRRTGVASALLADVEQRAAASGFNFVALDASGFNSAARALYERAGYELRDTRPPVPPLPAPSLSYAKRVR